MFDMPYGQQPIQFTKDCSLLIFNDRYSYGKFYAGGFILLEAITPVPARRYGRYLLEACLDQSGSNNVGVRMNLSSRRLPFKQPSSSTSRRAPICAASCQEMTNVLRHTLGDSPVTSTASGKVFITRHGERADLADEHWLAQAEVGPGAQFALAHRSVQQPVASRLLMIRL